MFTNESELYSKEEIFENLKKLESQRNDALKEEKIDGNKITKLYYAQLMQGLHLQNISF